MTEAELERAFGPWLHVGGAGEVMVQLRAPVVLPTLGRDGIIEPMRTVQQKNETTGEIEEHPMPPTQLLVGKLRVQGTVLLFEFRLTDTVTASMSLYPEDIQVVSRVERSVLAR